jgi:hypothetical protein
MSVCDEAAVNIDWQWTENAPPDKKAYDSCPAQAVDFYARNFKYVPGQGLVETFGNAEESIMSSLVFGQRHNQAAQQTYRNCLAQQPSIHTFMRLVVTAAPGRASDLADATGNIQWQVGANSASITNARNYWNQATATNDPNAKLYFGTLAADCLMGGQMHNPPVLQEYRACFRDNPDGLFAIVFHP